MKYKSSHSNSTKNIRMNQNNIYNANNTIMQNRIGNYQNKDMLIRNMSYKNLEKSILMQIILII